VAALHAAARARALISPGSASGRWPPNKPLELTPLRVEQDRADFEGWNWLDRFPDLSVRRSSAARRWAGSHQRHINQKTHLQIVHIDQFG